MVIIYYEEVASGGSLMLFLRHTIHYIMESPGEANDTD